jgi:hypothetical protein
MEYKIFLKDIEVTDIKDYEKVYRTLRYLENKFNYDCDQIKIYGNTLKMLQSLGGTVGSWEDDDLSIIEPDSITVEQIYIDFLDLNFNNCFKYKSEFFNIVEKRQYDENDYYGGSIEYIEWKVNIGILFGVAWALDLCDRDLFLTREYSEWSKNDFLNYLETKKEE